VIVLRLRTEHEEIAELTELDQPQRHRVTEIQRHLTRRREAAAQANASVPPCLRGSIALVSCVSSAVEGFS
jgi:hypothetical protein